VKNRFQNLPFKCNLQRYIADLAADQGSPAALVSAAAAALRAAAEDPAVGLCMLNQVDP
jgi:hypothetical protein